MAAETEKKPGAGGKLGAAAEVVKGFINVVTGGEKQPPKPKKDPLQQLRQQVEQGKAKQAQEVKQQAQKSVKEQLEEVKKAAQEVLKGRQPPQSEFAPSATTQELHKLIEQHKNTVEWLAPGKELPQNATVARVVAEIAQAPKELQENREFLLVKGAQLKHAYAAAVESTERAQIREFQDRIHAKVTEAYDLPAEKIKLDEQMQEGKLTKQEHKQKRELYDTITHHFSGYESGMAPVGHPPPESKWDPSQDSIPSDPQYQSLRDRLNRYNTEIDNLRQELEAAKQTNNRQVIAEAQNRLDDRVMELLVVEIPAMPRAEQSLIENFQLRANLENYRLDLVNQYISEGRGWSSLYVSEAKMRAYQLNALKEVRKEEDSYNLYRRLLGNRAQEAIDYQQRQNIGYLMSDDYPRDVMALFDNKANWPDIGTATGISVDPNHPERHPLYQRVADEKSLQEFRQILVDKLTYPDLLEKNYTSWLLGNLDKMSVGEAGFGEPGIMTILNNRGINTDCFDALETNLGNMRGPDGEMIVPTSAAQNAVIDETVEFLYTHREQIEHKWKAEYGPNEELTREDIHASVMEVYRMMAITGHRAKILRRHLNPVEGGGVGVNPHPFTGEPSGDNKLNYVIEPMREFFDRWKVASAVQRIWMETIGRLSARRFGLDAAWKKIIDKMDPTKEDYKRLVKHAFIITNDDKDHVREQLSVLRFNRLGKDTHFAPESVEEVTKDELLRWLIFRDGTHLAEPHLMAGYTFFEGSWRGDTQIKIYDELFGRNQGIGVLERLNLKVADLFDIKKGHHKIEEEREKLIHPDADPEKEGLMVTTARYMPIHVLRALDSKQNPLSEKFINDHFDGYNIFNDTFSNGRSEQELFGSVSSNRRDLFYQRYELRLSMINRGLADWEAEKVPDPNNPGQMIDNPLLKLDRYHPDRLKARGLPPIDWSQAQEAGGVWTVGTPDQMAVITKWCQATHVEPNDFIRVSKELSKFALEREVLEAAVHPLNAQYFLDVRKLDARLHRLDDGPKMWKEIPTEEKDIPTWRKRRLIGKWSQRLIAEAEGHGVTGGLPRWLGDQMNVFAVLVPHLVPLSKAKNPKEWEQHLEPFVDTVVNTGGSEARANVTDLLTAAYIIPNSMDAGKDFLGVSDENTHVEISMNQRAGGKGFKALTVQETDHAMHFGEAVAGEKFHDIFPHTHHEIMKEANLIVVPKIFGRELELKWPEFMNRFGEEVGKKLPNVIRLPGGNMIRVNWGNKFKRFFSGTIFPSLRTIWVHRIAGLLGLIAIIGAFQGVSSVQKGFSDAGVDAEHG